MTERSATLPSNDGPSHASVFIWLFAVSSIWHYTSAYDDLAAFWLQFDPVVTPMIFLSIATAFMAACAPQKTWTLLVMAAGQLVAICARFPFVADHLVMELFLNVSVLLSFAYLAYKRNTLAISTDDMFALFSPIGRWLLIVMYFYGTFHKINPGFLTPYSSCAIPFI